MADSKISALTVQAAANGSEIMLAVDTGSNVKITTNQVRNYTHKASHPGYISGNWYCINEETPFSGTSNGNVVAATNTLFTPFVVWSDVTISDLGARVTTTGTNMKIGLYANNNTTMRPSGACLGATGNISTGSTGNVSGALSGGNVSLTPGVYWIAYGSDNTALRLLGSASNTTANFFNSIVSGSTIGAVTGSGTVNTGFSVTEAAYGTFGNMSSGPPTFNTVGTAALAWFFKVA